MSFFTQPTKWLRIHRKILSRRLKIATRDFLKSLGYGEIYVARSLRKRKLREVKKKTESLTRDAIYEHGKRLAEEQRVSFHTSSRRLLYRRFRFNCKVLDLAHSVLEESARNQETLTPGAEWLLDNYHLVLQQISAIKKHFPRGYDKTLPKLAAGRFADYPRVYDLALELLQKTDAVANVDLLTSFIRGYQSHSAMTMGEIWAIPIMIRFALIENLSAIVTRMADAREERKAAALLINEIIGDESKTGTQILNALSNYINQRPDLIFRGSSHIITRLREMGRKAYLALQWLEERIREEGLDPEELHRTEQYLLAADQVSIGNTFNSLRFINLIDWKDWFEEVSLVEKALSQDPSGFYKKGDFKTRDSYRHVIEEIAKQSGRSEVELAGQVVEFCEKRKQELEEEGHQPGLFLSKRIHVGFYLVGKGLEEFERYIGFRPALTVSMQRLLKKNAFALYAGSVIMLTCILLFQLIKYMIFSQISFLPATLIALFFIIPASDLSISFVQWLITHLVRPDFLSKLDFSKGIPAEAKTAVVVQAIFNDKASVKKSIEALEIRYLANNDKNAVFGMLADFPDAAAETMPGDEELLSYSEELISELKSRHGDDIFFVLFRRRKWNPAQERFMGWERKRGKIEEFNKLIVEGGETSFILNDKHKQILREIVYVITLDNDSQLPHGSLQKLVGTIAHPLNAPLVADSRDNPSDQRVTEGYSLIQPRVGVSLVSASSSRFARLFSGHAGLDPYTQTVSEVYQDLFHEGTFVGKGIYKAEAFHLALKNRVPENSILSHDLFEGSFARVALATDIELFEDFSTKYHVHARRQHRWVRGDWQLLPWIFSHTPDAAYKFYRTALSPLARWKLIDNLRRSLLAPSLLLYFTSLLLLLQEVPFALALLGALVVAFPVYANVAQAFLIPPRGLSLEGHVKGLGRDIFVNSKQALATFSFIPHQAYLMVNAIVVTLYRLIVSRKKLLEWETAYHSERRLSGSLVSFFKEMYGGILLTLLIFLAIALLAPQNALPASVLCLFWVTSPFVAKYLSDPYLQQGYKVEVRDRQYLKEIALHTWRYFREHMTADNNFLVPDNIQFVPHRIVVDRSSITNISLSLLTVVSAYDFGFLSLPQKLRLLDRIYDSLHKLERYHGHFYNWYNIKTLAPLHPRYISMVDSGNMLGYLICMRTIYADIKQTPVLSMAHWSHVSYILAKLAAQSNSRELSSTLGELAARFSALNSNTPADVLSRLAVTREFAAAFSSQPVSPENHEARRLLSELDDITDVSGYLVWLPALQKILDLLDEGSHKSDEISLMRTYLAEETFSLGFLEAMIERLSGFESYLKNSAFADSLGVLLSPHIQEFSAKLKETKAFYQQTCSTISGLQDLNRKFIEEMDFRFLYDADRDLFPVGYDVDNARRDQSFYDLLASEARLGSFSAIALGQIPQKHWFSLGRPLTDAIGGKVLLSWSGTMFEYLMPVLLTKDFPGTLLSESFKAAVRTQILYGAKRGVPWGISESGYSGVDFEKTYQYHAFGAPGLGLKRGLESDLVISPYSTFMALPIAYDEGLENLKALEAEGARGEYGFYEAIDYTPARLHDNERKHVVESHLAHHQGIIVVALNNLLNDNIMQERFHKDLQVRATELLLHEKFPERIPLITPHSERDFALQRVEEEEEHVTTQNLSSPHSALPVTHLLSNSHYSLMVDNAGSGFSSLDREIGLTRWKEDPVLNDKGFYVFIRDLEQKHTWSATYQPTCYPPDSYDVIFGPDKAEFKRRNHDIFTHTEITISPEDNVEIRRITFSNLSEKRRTLDITSYGEVLLGSIRADNAHPAFAKMFIESEYLSDLDCLIFSRRPRSKHESKLYFMHMLNMRTVWSKTFYETSRADFLGRGNMVRNARAMKFGEELGGHVGYVLDPVFSLRTKLELEGGQSETVTFVNAASKDKEQLLSLAHRYKQIHQISRAFELAWSQSSVELRNEKIAARQSQVFQRLANVLLFNYDKLRAKPEVISQNRLTQPALWRLGISGDLPIVLLRITEPDQLKIVQELLSAHYYLRARGVVFDLIILNEYPGGYLQNLQEELEFIVRSSFSGFLVDKNGGVFIRTSSQVSQQESDLLHVIARAIFSGSKGSLASQLKFEEAEGQKYAALNSPIVAKQATSSMDEIQDCEFFNGIGGFADRGQTYRIRIKDDKFPPLPWSNVIATAGFGTLITEAGSGYTWSDNSRENRLTTWSNDPISDPAAEVIYLRDVDTSKYWSLTPRPVRSDATYIVDHSLGESRFSTEIENVHSALTVTIDSSEKIKYWNIELKNTGKKAKEIEVFLYVEWVLGVSRDDTSRFMLSGFDSQSKILYAQNYYNVDFPGRLLGIGSQQDIKSFTTQRVEFLGRNGSLAEPYAFLASDIHAGVSLNLNKKLSVGTDSSGIIKINVRLQPEENKSLLFYMLEASSLADLRIRHEKLKELKPAADMLPGVRNDYLRLADNIQVKTPDRSFDILMNNWLLYQVMSCRLFARTGFYQSGGAFGFRDQLQDVMSLMYSRPELARSQILLHASRQFPEGDVQHWWHPPSGKGVRTKISDDFLWLPYVTAKYLDFTGDYSILDEQVHFVSAPLLGENDHEIYIVPQNTSHTADLFTHCMLAIERGARLGRHGLPLMGAGDWNDGMNEVGVEGKGESVWLAWFYIEVLRLFTEITDRRGMKSKSEEFTALRERIRKSIEENAWDGEWYRRAYFDDGTPLGSHTNDECKIDSISQSWGVISGAAGAERAKTAMQSVLTHLVKKDHKIISLLQPAFNDGSLQPGYIKGYLPGIRENGGQYTHAAAWTIIAEAMAGNGDSAVELFSLINPVNHTKDSAGVDVYKGEPYVFCGDVYAVSPHEGRAGWSWYTGSAGWMYSAGIEHILGLKLKSDHFSLAPCIPASWREYALMLSYRGVRYHIKVENASGRQKSDVVLEVDGKTVPDGKVLFESYKGRLEVEVRAILS